MRKSVIEDDGKRLLLNTRWDQSLQNELKRRAQILSITLGAMNAFTWFFEPDKNRISFGEGFNEVTKKASEICSVEKFLSCVHPDRFCLWFQSMAWSHSGSALSAFPSGQRHVPLQEAPG